jgi:hypothetical protein
MVGHTGYLVFARAVNREIRVETEVVDIDTFEGDGYGK